MKNFCLKYAFLIILSCFALNSCGQTSQKQNEELSSNPTIPDTNSHKLNFDSAQIVGFFKRFPLLKMNQQDVTDFYRQRNFSYAWFDDGLVLEQANNLTQRILNFKGDGLRQAIPYQPVLDSLMNPVAPIKNGQRPSLQLELMLTSQYFSFSKAVYGGINVSDSKATGWLLPRKKVAYSAYLDTLLNARDKTSPAREPVYRQYELLRKYLQKYNRLQAQDKWLPIAVTGKWSPGDTASVIRLVRARLNKLEDFTGDTLNRTYDFDLQNGIKHFQYRHGLTVNGALNKETVAELNVPLQKRITQILVNMERSRWLPVNLNTGYVAVNIPEFKMHVYYADSLLWSCNVVVGKAQHATTAFYGEIKYVVFSPYWNVPPGILAKEVLPGIKKNGAYLQDHRMEITGYENGRPVVRQKPGNDNSLGLVKFLFPNSYNIYLHDTPSKSLFGETSRAFSHGCIRIAEPEKFAAFLLQDDSAWTREKINRSMNAGKERYVTLAKKMPVFIAYFTAFADREGYLNFRKDIYNLDHRLARMLMYEDEMH